MVPAVGWEVAVVNAVNLFHVRAIKDVASDGIDGWRDAAIVPRLVRWSLVHVHFVFWQVCLQAALRACHDDFLLMARPLGVHAQLEASDGVLPTIVDGAVVRRYLFERQRYKRGIDDRLLVGDGLFGLVVQTALRNRTNLGQLGFLSGDEAEQIEEMTAFLYQTVARVRQVSIPAVDLVKKRIPILTDRHHLDLANRRQQRNQLCDCRYEPILHCHPNTGVPFGMLGELAQLADLLLVHGDRFLHQNRQIVLGPSQQRWSV
mmetsp:Transcript_17009/g.47781  ORF Transcript_17009/g.47781 Transcript_17009/m.47781 type:complete len:261 (-) Transcript_17009:36-818(-)